MTLPSAVRPATARLLLQVRDLKTYFPVYGGLFSKQQGSIHAVDGVSFNVYEGETLGLVGESGCGKSTLAQTIMQIVHATSGSAIYDGVDLFGLTEEDLRKSRSQMQIIFQDPYSSLDPRMSIGEIVGEPLLVHGMKEAAERKQKVLETLEVVGLESSYYERYPHEFSGGQRQRISIARSIIVRPKLIFCDEPVSALDVSIQSQILNLLKHLQDRFGLTYVFISHALNVIRYVSDRVCVMYLGKVVEMAASEDLFTSPCHPYTQALLSAIPIPDPSIKRERIILKGDLPSPRNPPAGCRFNTRCVYSNPLCFTQEPQLRELGPGHFAACHLCDPGRAKSFDLKESVTI